MTTIGTAGAVPGTPGIFERERIIATAGFNRWLVPPAALCIHLCIGMAYGFSVFWLPLSQALSSPASKEVCDGNDSLALKNSGAGAGHGPGVADG